MNATQTRPRTCPAWCLGQHLGWSPTGTARFFHHDGEDRTLVPVRQLDGDDGVLIVRLSQFVDEDGVPHPVHVELQDRERTSGLLSPAEARQYAWMLLAAADLASGGETCRG